jgi:hypothetical protein
LGSGFLGAGFLAGAAAFLGAGLWAGFAAAFTGFFLEAVLVTTWGSVRSQKR